VQAKGEMQGEIRLTCSIALGERFVVPILHDYLNANPKISIEVELTNRIVDVIGDGYDIGIRTGSASDRRLSARQITSRSLVTCASPSYLEQYGAPRHPHDLSDHHCLVGINPVWHYREQGRSLTITPAGRWRCNSGTAVSQAAAAGLGICQLPTFFVVEELESGSLVRLLEEFSEAPEPVWMVYPPRRYMVPKVRGLLDRLETGLLNSVC
jgi:DNA-binding transcriptional LysR family regulator